MSFETNYGKLEELYKNYLDTIKEIKFTFREIDLIACIINNRGEKKIASLLSISPRTVSAHVYNIMNKIGCNSKDQIIDFIESSGKLLLFREYYLHLLIKAEFERLLTKIGKQHNRNGLSYICDPNFVENNLLYLSIKQHLKLANVNIFKNTISNNNLTFIDLSIITAKNYYYDILNYLKILITTPAIEEAIKEFDVTYKSLEKMNQSGHLISITNNYYPFIKQLLRKKTLWMSLVIVFLAMTLLTIFIGNQVISNKKLNVAIADNEIIKQLEQFLSAETQEFSADNITQDKAYKNNDIIKHIETIFDPLNQEEVKNYANRLDIPANKLIRYLYNLHALASHYSYVNHNGEKARKILLFSKEIVENYVSSYSHIALSFDKLSPPEILAEVKIIKDLPQIYTRILYSLGKTYIYQGDLQIGKQYLSIRSGLGIIYKIEADQEIKKGQLQEARKILQKTLETYYALRTDNNNYIVDYIPGTQQQKIISPQEDIYNMAECNDKLIETYIKLIKISGVSGEISSYLQEIEKQVTGSENYQGLLDLINKLPVRKATGIYNNLGNLLLELDILKINSDNLISAIKTKLTIKQENKLEIIHCLFNYALLKSRNTDYTKADAYQGLINLNQRKLQILQLSQEETNLLKEEIKTLEEKRDYINKGLNRDQLRIKN